MKKKALLTKHKSNFLDVAMENAFAKGLEMAGFEVEKMNIDRLSENIDSLPIESYDLIGMDVQLNALWGCNKKRAAMFEKLISRAKYKAVTIYSCDLALTMKTGMWDEGENHLTHKRNVFNGKPVRVIASYDKSIMNDEKSMDRVNTAWMKGLHKDSSVHFIEWLTFNYYTYARDFAVQPKLINNDQKIRKFYYGIKRSHIAKSLERMGLNSEEDLVYGLISDSVKNEEVRKIRAKVKRPFTWVEYVNNSENVLFPHEPIKTDYQITLRLLEALLFYKDKIIFDDRVNPRLHKYAKEHIHWENKTKKSAEEIKALYE